MLENWWGYKVRAAVSAGFLSGEGLEIGAGSNPQELPPGCRCRYFDKSDKTHLQQQFGSEIPYEVFPMRRIKEFFPHGADFLIAHNVLEHVHGEIAALQEWHSYVRVGGVIVLSVPLRDHTTGDNFRLSASIDHLIDDFAMNRGPESFEAREHSYSFCLGWDAGDLKAWSYLNRD